ncbi:hypothetical protein LDB17_08160, partial [Dysgonomonas sp. Shenzhen-Wh21]|uniref:hypothetical protein n=1 Tax=Dysgonomonas sp. Shenzhen-Wh21 TaxID=2878548 RepID=UPI00372CF0EF
YPAALYEVNAYSKEIKDSFQDDADRVLFPKLLVHLNFVCELSPVRLIPIYSLLIYPQIFIILIIFSHTNNPAKLRNIMENKHLIFHLNLRDNTFRFKI